MSNFDPNVLHNYIKNMTFQNSLIFLGSRAFHHFNDTYIYKILNNFTKDTNFNHSQFLNKKEMYYKIRYREYKLDDDILWHLLKRRIESNITFPNLNPKHHHKERESICGKLSVKECKEKFESKNILPNLIYSKNEIDIWHLVRLFLI